MILITNVFNGANEALGVSLSPLGLSGVLSQSYGVDTATLT
jgi:hypothetical protein